MDDLDIPEQTAPKGRSVSALTAMVPCMLPRSADTDTRWEAFRRYAGLDHDNFVVGSFGGSPEMATELANLAIVGIKRATASLARDYGEGREPTPRPGDFVIMLDGKERPRSSGEPPRSR